MKKSNVGTAFDDWLREEDILEEITASAIKRVLARQVPDAPDQDSFSNE